MEIPVKTYWIIGGTLLVLTVVTVTASYVDFAVPLAIAVALIIAATKGSLVASYFMHLVGERRGIYAVLLLTAVFFLMLLFVPILIHVDRIGEPWTLPNANAPAAGAHDEVLSS
jgi:caa(3)-type oxidase subunit IV